MGLSTHTPPCATGAEAGIGEQTYRNSPVRAERGPFVTIRKCLNQNGFRAEPVAAVQCVIKSPREVGGGLRQAMPELAWPSGRCRLAGNDVGGFIRLAKRSRQIAADHQFSPRCVVTRKLAGALQPLATAGQLGHCHRADDSLQVAKPEPKLALRHATS